MRPLALLSAALVTTVGCSGSGEGSPESVQQVSTSIVEVAEVADESLANGDELVLEQLREAGADLESPRVIEHFLYFDDEQSLADAGLAAQDAGCETNVSAPIPEAPQWGLICLLSEQRIDIDIITEHRSLLERIASDHGGIYDGWGTAIG